MDPRGDENQLHLEYDYCQGKKQTSLLRGCLGAMFSFFILLVLVLPIRHQHPHLRSESERTRDLKVNGAKPEQLSSVWVLPVVAAV